ncbi:MAG: hypothetical protein J6T47_09580 [Lachnospiraceae bacterium]|nr:hypothetical protein [Lachnospiraceae bacterium]
MLTIESDLKTHKKQAEEITNILVQYRTLLRKPACKLQNFFRFCPIAMVLSLVASAVLGVFMATGHTTNALLDWITIFILFVLFFFSFIMFRTIRKIRDDMMKQEGMVTVVLDEEGIDYDDHNGKKLKLGWNTVSFLREFNECISFLPKESTGNGIFLERIEFNKVVQYLDEIDVEIRVFRNEA